MALTALERRSGALWFCKKHFAEKSETANLPLDAVEDAFEAAVNWLRGTEQNSATLRKVTLNNAFAPAFKKNATLAQKSTILAAAALFEGGII